MKRLLLIVLPLLLIVGCSTDIDTLQKRGDTYYKVNSDKPFSGLIVNKYESGQKKSKGYLTNGKEDGIWTYWYKDHPINYFRLYMDNIMDNLPYIFYDSWENYGQKSKEVDYFDGKTLDVLYKKWDDNGQKEEGTLKDGKLDGFVTEWYENGQKKYETIYKDGNLISKKEWNEDGSVKE